MVNEKASPESRVCPREPRDFEKGTCEEEPTNKWVGVAWKCLRPHQYVGKYEKF